MLALRSRTTPLIASSLLFVSFFFVTIHSGEGLQCYLCYNVLDGNCIDGLNDDLLINCTSPNNIKSSMMIPQLSAASPVNSGNSLPIELAEKINNAPESKYGCFRLTLNIATNVSDYSLVYRGCTQMDSIVIPYFQANGTIRNGDYFTCDTDKCNSSGTIEITTISFILSLIASFLASR